MCSASRLRLRSFQEGLIDVNTQGANTSVFSSMLSPSSGAGSRKLNLFKTIKIVMAAEFLMKAKFYQATPKPSPLMCAFRRLNSVESPWVKGK